jgi:tRNA modification GTPase
MYTDTIFALSSGLVPSGVAIVRISGPKVRFALETMIGFIPENRKAVLSNISGRTGELIDRGLTLFFQAPNSFTGGDCGEFHIHGGRAVVDAVLFELGSFDSFRLAEPGEFSRRAFENGKLDLTEVEGLSDLIAANTNEQRIQALSLSNGSLRDLYSDWRSRLIRLRALLEAELDFSEEEDVSENINSEFIRDLDKLTNEISRHLNTSQSGEIIRNGFRVTLMGSPNSGKSSLLNALAKRDVAIVSEYAGTTRDVISVNLNIRGYEVIVSDTAGIRETSEVVESIGISRAFDSSKFSNLTVWLNPSDSTEDISSVSDSLPDTSFLGIISKSDLVDRNELSADVIHLSVVDGTGIRLLEEAILKELKSQIGSSNEVFLVRHRHKLLLRAALVYLSGILDFTNMPVELVSEQLRLASDQIGRIMGKIDVEDLLDVIFSEFCIGK